MALRQVIADKGADPLTIKNLAEIEPDAPVPGLIFSLNLAEPSPLEDERTLWSNMIGVFLWNGMKRPRQAIMLGEVQGGESPDAKATMMLKTTTPLAGQMVAVQLLTWNFPEITADIPPAPAVEFTLRGPRSALERLKNETGVEEDFPNVTFDGWTATGELSKPVAERDLRATAESFRLGRVFIIGQDVVSSRYRVNLSYDQVKEQISEVFRPIETRRITPEFTDINQKPDDKGRVPLLMALSEPLTISEIEHYLTAAFGASSQGLIMEDLGLDARTKEVTLRLPADKVQRAKELITKAFDEPQPVQKIVSIGSVVAQEMKGRAILAVVCASIVIIIYMGLRFHAVKYGVAAVVALLHDLSIMAGAVAIADWSGVIGDVKINLPMLAAFLTIMGYSVNDTIVVFDRIRENIAKSGRPGVTPEIIDASVNQTLSRTTLTSFTTLIVVVVLYLLGGPVLQGFAFALIVGIVVGTYSSVFIASPLLIDWGLFSRKKA
jgi:preprotein translocase SecF subunit